MAFQVIKQPELDGEGHPRLAIFDSTGDRLVVWDATENEVVEWFAERAARQASEGARWVTQHVLAGGSQKIYHRFALSWQDALAKDREHDGEASKEFGERPAP